MLLRLQSEGVDVDTDSGDVGVVLVRLDPVEVVAITDSEAIVAVELDEGSDYRVVTSHTLNTGDGVTGLEDGAVPPVAVVERLLALPGVDDGVVAADERVALYNPDELLARVVEVELDLVGRGGDGLAASELEGVNQVLVGDLGELTALVSVQVDVVNIQRGCNEALGRDAVADDVGVGDLLGSIVPAHVAQVIELQVDAHLVVLEGDQGQSQTRVAVKPELERNVQGVLRGALLDLVRSVGGTGAAVGVAVLTTLDQYVHQLGDVTNHLGVASLLARLLGELIPDLEPVSVMLIDALATNLDLDIADQIVTRPVEPAELGARAVRAQQGDLGQSGLQVHAVDQVTIALDGAGDLLAKVRGTIERVLNGLHGEVSVTTIHNLEESDLRVTRQIDVLGAVGDELHKTTTCHFLLYPCLRKKIWKTARV